MKRWFGIVLSLLIGSLTGACSVDFELPDDIIIHCDPEQACPEGYRCVEDINAQGVCVGAEPLCGNGVLEAEEFCDSGDENTSGYVSGQVCRTDCMGYAPHCGDGERQGAVDQKRISLPRAQQRQGEGDGVRLPL